MPLTETSKRVFDLVIGTTLALLTLPVLLVAAVVTAISLRTWPFFTQTRVGRDGKPFRFVKLRTLPAHAPRYATKYELTHLHVPRLSMLLRRTHLDELPQLYLVVLGKMSLVGPRPEMPHLHEAMPRAFAASRTSVRPGCTGLWQISEHCMTMIHEHPEVDGFYVRHQSLRFDLWIMAQTALIFLSANRSPVRLDALPEWLTAERVIALDAVEVDERLRMPEASLAEPSFVGIADDR